MGCGHGMRDVVGTCNDGVVRYEWLRYCLTLGVLSFGGRNAVAFWKSVVIFGGL